jgi:hypothetical protein
MIFFLPTPPKQSDSSTFIFSKIKHQQTQLLFYCTRIFLIHYCSWGTPSELLYYNILAHKNTQINNTMMLPNNNFFSWIPIHDFYRLFIF